MQVRVETDNDDFLAQVQQWWPFYLTGLDDDADSIVIAVGAVEDASGATLYRCSIRAQPARGDPLELTETQSDPALAINRALDRTARTLRRRLRALRVSRFI